MNHIEIKILEIKRPPKFRSGGDDPWQGENIKGHTKDGALLTFVRFRHTGELELTTGKIYFGSTKPPNKQGNDDVFTPKHEIDRFDGDPLDVEELPDSPFDPPKSKLKFDSRNEKSIVTQSLIRSACITWGSHVTDCTLLDLIDELCKKYKEKMEGDDW